MSDQTKIMILNVDDDEAGLYAKSRILRQAGYEVIEASTGQEALRLAAVRRPALALLDVKLPDLSGVEVCRRIKNDPHLSIYVLQISATMVEASDKTRALESGADTYLTEPVEPEVLIATVRALLRLQQAETRLRQREQQLRIITDGMPGLIAHVDLELCFRFVNASYEKWFGKTREQIIGQTMRSVHGASYLELEPYIQRALAGETVTFEAGHQYADGYKTVLAQYVPDINLEGDVVGFYVQTTDISERKRVEEEREELLHREQRARWQVEEASRLKDEFLATISHELRTPLNTITGWVSLLRRGGLDAPTVAGALESIERNAQMQGGVIEDLLDVSQIITGKLQLKMQPLSPASFIQAAVATARPATEAKAIKLTLTLDPKASYIYGDASRLQQVVWNLLSNAIKFTPGGGRVHLWLKANGTRIEIGVSDTGAGISTDFLPFVFDRFRQADSSTTRRHNGLGLGLALVRHLVELHGGEVTAFSKGEGLGSAFVVHLPVSGRRGGLEGGIETPDTELLRLREPTSFSLPPDLLAGLKILLVNEETDGGEILAKMLERQGAEVVAADSAENAIRLLEENRPNVLIAETSLTDEAGFDLIRSVRTLPAEQGGKVLALAITDCTDTEAHIRALWEGYQMFVAKPVEMGVLTLIIASLIGEASKGASR